jgi:hypothetical protein
MFADAIRAAGGIFESSMIVFRVETASGAHSRARAFTSATILLASIVCVLFGRPPGLPELPALKLVERNPPRGIVSVRLFGRLFKPLCCLFQPARPRSCDVTGRRRRALSSELPAGEAHGGSLARHAGGDRRADLRAVGAGPRLQPGPFASEQNDEVGDRRKQPARLFADFDP